MPGYHCCCYGEVTWALVLCSSRELPTIQRSVLYLLCSEEVWSREDKHRKMVCCCSVLCPPPAALIMVLLPSPWPGSAVCCSDNGNQFQLYLLINIQLKMQGRVEPGVQVPAGPGREVEGSLLCYTYSVSGDPRSLPALTLTMPHCSLIARAGRDPNLDS